MVCSNINRHKSPIFMYYSFPYKVGACGHAPFVRTTYDLLPAVHWVVTQGTDRITSDASCYTSWHTSRQRCVAVPFICRLLHKTYEINDGLHWEIWDTVAQCIRWPTCCVKLLNWYNHRGASLKSNVFWNRPNYYTNFFSLQSLYKH